jgi:hypothetical protein
MANSDYSTKGLMGSFTTVVSLAGNIGRHEFNLPVANWKRVGGDVRRVGEGVMIGTKEICMLTGWTENTITVARGCADTIPQPHQQGTPIWFYEDAVGIETAPNERAASTTVGVKILPTTVGGGQLALTNSPPNALTFNQRYARPYPPGKVLVNGARWENGAFLDSINNQVVVTWAHRDRKLQANLLVWHEENSIGPEPGTTYIVRIFKSNGSPQFPTWPVVRTVTGIVGSTFTYPYVWAQQDFGPGYFGVANMSLASVRDGLESWQHYDINFTVVTDGSSGDTSGWGYNYGNNWGGDA